MAENDAGQALVADRRLWLTEDRSRVVEEGDADAAFLLASEGSAIDAGEAARLELRAVDGKVKLAGARAAAKTEAAPARKARKTQKAAARKRGK